MYFEQIMIKGTQFEQKWYTDGWKLCEKLVYRKSNFWGPAGTSTFNFSKCTHFGALLTCTKITVEYPPDYFTGMVISDFRWPHLKHILWMLAKFVMQTTSWLIKVSFVKHHPCSLNTLLYEHEAPKNMVLGTPW